MKAADFEATCMRQSQWRRVGASSGRLIGLDPRKNCRWKRKTPSLLPAPTFRIVSRHWGSALEGTTAGRKALPAAEITMRHQQSSYSNHARAELKKSPRTREENMKVRTPNGYLPRV